jgi:hypothetical protein
VQLDKLIAESSQPAGLKDFVEASLPFMIQVLQTTEPQTSNTEKQRLRFAVLEFMAKRIFATQVGGGRPVYKVYHYFQFSN